MELIDQFELQTECDYKDEHYLVRDNGSVCRMPKDGKRPRPLDNQWTFGTKDEKNGYMTVGGHRVHIIVATAFHGARDSKKYVVDHIDTNRCNNRKENLRWLTRLENVLLNPITMAKIEHSCGSVENFLNNPSMLDSHVSEDANFGWMRTVSKEEAQNTLASWQRLISKPRPKAPSSGAIGEWIYGPGYVSEEKRAEIKEEEKRKKAELAEKRKAEMIAMDEARKQKLREEAEAEKRKEAERIKRIYDAIFTYAEEKGWVVTKNAKGEGWKADLMITAGDERIAIRIFNRGRKPQEEYFAMKNESVRGLWLGDAFYYDNEEPAPSFNISTVYDSERIRLHDDTTVAIGTFLKAFIERRLVMEHSAEATAIKVRFVPDTCYNCGAKHYFYLVLGGYQGNEFFGNMTFDSFDPVILQSIQRFLGTEIGQAYKMGHIKERHSKTMARSYPSFGCPECDAIVGNHYVNDAFLDYAYEADDKDVHRIELEHPMSVSIKCWVIKK